MTGKTLGQRIYFARVHQGKCSLATFGQRVAEQEGRETPYHPATVSDWENDRSAPSLTALQAIARAGNVRPEWLVLHSGIPNLAA